MMIKPNKYTNLDLSVINVGGMILKSLSACSIQKYEDLESYIIATLGNPSKAVFVNALSYLFTVGRINYQESTDTINLVQR